MFNSKEYPRPPYLSLTPGPGLPPFPYPQHPLAHHQPQQQPLAVQPPLSPLVTKATGKRFNDGKYVHDPSGSSFFNKFNFLPFTKFNPFPFQVTPFVRMSMTPVETKRCPTFTEGTDKWRKNHSVECHKLIGHFQVIKFSLICQHLNNIMLD